MSLSKELEKMKYDKRLMDWYVSRGLVSKADMKKYLDGLPDLASNVETFSVGAGGAGASSVGDDEVIPETGTWQQ